MTLVQTHRSVVSAVSLIVFTFIMSACQHNQTATSSTPVKPAIAPGSIHLTVQIVTCIERPNNVKSAMFDCDATVLSVQEYGAGTTQLPESTAVRISFRDSLVKKTANSVLHPGSELSLVIQSTRDTSEADTHPKWDAVFIEN